MRRLLPFCIAVSLTCAPPAMLPTSQRPDLARLVAVNIGVLDSATLVMQFPAPPIFAVWRFEVEMCSGVAREGWPTFWVGQRPILNRAGALGMFIHDERRVVLGLGNETVAWVVRHELLHDALNIPKGQDAHPERYFKELCGALVYPQGFYQ